MPAMVVGPSDGAQSIRIVWYLCDDGSSARRSRSTDSVAHPSASLSMRFRLAGRTSQHVADGEMVVVGFYAHGPAGRTLRVEVDDEHRPPCTLRRCRQAQRQRGLSDPTLLVEHCGGRHPSMMPPTVLPMGVPSVAERTRANLSG
jgi:hypothetical protein